MAKDGLTQRPVFITATRIGGAGLGFLTQLLLAHVLGASGLGLFYSATSLAIVAGYVTSLGYSQTASRFAARYRTEGRSFLFGRFVTRASMDCLAAGALAAALVVAAAALAPGLTTEQRLTYGVAGIMALATTSLTLYTNIAAAIRSFALCYLPEGLIRPALFFVAVLGFWALGEPLSALAATAMFAITTAAVAVVQFVATRRLLPPFEWPRRGDRRITGRWRREAAPLILLSLYTNAFADIGILFATPFLPSEEVAIFGLCLKLSLLIGYVVQITQQMAVPDLADARIGRDPAAFRAALRRAVLPPLAITAIATIACVVAGREILGLFGPQFSAGHIVLVIAVASQVVRAAAGPGSQVLNLAGAQGTAASLCVVSLVVYVVTTVALAPFFGPEGVAFAVLISFATWVGGNAVALARLGEPRADAAAVFGGEGEKFHVARPATLP